MYYWNQESRRRNRKAAGNRSVSPLSRNRTDYYANNGSYPTGGGDYSGFGSSTVPAVPAAEVDLPIPRNCSSGVILMSDGRGGVRQPEADDKKTDRTTDGRRIESEYIRLTVPATTSRIYSTMAAAAEVSNLSAKLEYERPAPRFVPFQTGMDLLADALPVLPTVVLNEIGDYMTTGFRVRACRHTTEDLPPFLTAMLRYFDMRDRLPPVRMVSLHAPPDDDDETAKPRSRCINLFSPPLCQDKTARFEIAEPNAWIRVWFEYNGIDLDDLPSVVHVHLAFDPL
jgi:hypothetical protein